MSELQIGIVVKVKKVVGYNFEFPYFDPTGMEGIVVAYDASFPNNPWVVEMFEEPDGTPDAITRLYPELYAEDELEAME